MTDSAVIPDELSEVKADDMIDAADLANKTSGDDSKKVEKPPKGVIEGAPVNAIVAPSNCDLANNSVCYEVFKDEDFVQCNINYRMADSDRIVYPDEVDAAKAAAVKAAASADKTSGGDSNTVEQVEVPKQASITMRNMIITPTNCDMATNGVCYPVYKDDDFKS
uniref:Uncharacterized protein n=1 Tax=Heliothis virescens TaxID=7102 RepID=A0A2A4K1G0_HELVI